MIIGVCGSIGAGKDTLADYLVNVHEFRRESYAGTLKDAVAAVFGWDRTLLEGRTRQAREWREEVDAWWAQRLANPNLTPRWVLQQWGTEVCRRGFHDDIWIASIENKLRHSRDDVVISDCRFPNEINSIRRQGGFVVRVVRGPDPEWFGLALQANRGDQQSRDSLQTYGVHASETAWIGTTFDAVIDNNGSLDDLYHGISDLLRDLRVAKADRS